MNEPVPFMVLRARVRPHALAEFDAWFHQVHLADVQRIPGIARARTARTAGGTRLGIYEFAGADAMGQALNSPEAAYARGAWTRWAPDLDELGVEIMAPLVPLPIYQSAS